MNNAPLLVIPCPRKYIMVINMLVAPAIHNVYQNWRVVDLGVELFTPRSTISHMMRTGLGADAMKMPVQLCKYAFMLLTTGFSHPAA